MSNDNGINGNGLRWHGKSVTWGQLVLIILPIFLTSLGWALKDRLDLEHRIVSLEQFKEDAVQRLNEQRANIDLLFNNLLKRIKD